MAAKKTAKTTKAKTKMGRPPRAGEAATRAVNVRFTSDEWERVEAAALAAGATVTEFVRDAALSLIESS